MAIRPSERGLRHRSAWHPPCSSLETLSRVTFPLGALTTANCMNLFAARSVQACDVASDEADFPLPIADPSLPAMHRRCVLNGCSDRNGFIFAAVLIPAAGFLVRPVALRFY